MELSGNSLAGIARAVVLTISWLRVNQESQAAERYPEAAAVHNVVNRIRISRS